MKHTVKKTDAIELCKKIANDYDGWEFIGGNFKNKKLKHTDVLLHLGLSVSAGAGLIQPSTRVINKKIKLLEKKSLMKSHWIVPALFDMQISKKVMIFIQSAFIH